MEEGRKERRQGDPGHTDGWVHYLDCGCSHKLTYKIIPLNMGCLLCVGYTSVKLKKKKRTETPKSGSVFLNVWIYCLDVFCLASGTMHLPLWHSRETGGCPHLRLLPRATAPSCPEPQTANSPSGRQQVVR